MWWTNVLPIVNKYNHWCIFPDHVDVSISMEKNEDSSHSIHVMIQTIDRRNLSIQTFNIPRIKWIAECELIDNEILLSLQGKNVNIRNVIPEILELLDWAESKKPYIIQVQEVRQEVWDVFDMSPNVNKSG